MNSSNQGTSWPSTIKPVLVEVEWIRKQLQDTLKQFFPYTNNGQFQKLRESIEALLNAKELGGKEQ